MHQLYKIMHAFAGFICIKPNSHLVFNFIGMQAEGIFFKKNNCCLLHVSYFEKLAKNFQVSCHRIASKVKLFWKHVLDGST